MASTRKILKAFDFAAQKHIDQRRKGERQEPYLNHLTEVADLLVKYAGDKDTTLIVGGILHDTIEDTKTTRDELKKKFGEAVTRLVEECTDDKSLDKPVRKQLQVDHAPHKSKRAKMVKMADKISNLRATLKSPPKGWDLARREEYFEWAKKVADGLQGANAGLDRLFDKTYKQGIKALAQEKKLKGPKTP